MKWGRQHEQTENEEQNKQREAKNNGNKTETKGATSENEEQ